MNVLIAGDICFENRAEQLLKNSDSIFSEEFNNYWNSKDFRLANLETPITKEKNKIAKVGRHIKASPEIGNGISKLGIDYFSLANNHIMDYGVPGLKDTIDFLDLNGINYFGIKINNKINSFIILEKDDVKVGVIAISNNEFSVENNFKGIGAIGFDSCETIKIIESLKDKVNHIIVIWHTGLSKFKYPSPNQREMCKRFIDHGASVVTCQHSHIVGANEYYNGGFICYGQGSTVFDLNRIKFDWNFGITLDIHFSKEKFEVNLVGHYQFGENENIRLLNETEKEKIIKEEAKINNILENENLWLKEWELYISEKEGSYFKDLFLSGSKIGSKLKKYIPFNKFLSAKSKLVLLNYLQNEEHRELMIDLLKKDLQKR